MRLLLALCVASAAASAVERAAEPDVTWTNWAFNQAFNVADILTATYESDVASILAANSRVKVIGAGHSFSPIDGQLSFGVLLNLVPPTTGAIVQLDALHVRVHGGVHLWELNSALETMGLAMENLGAIANQTVAGATATNTHGTGPTTGLSGFITGITIVLANGTTLYCNATMNSAVFAAARTGYGALGVLVWLDLAVVPLWRMERIQVPYNLDALLSALPALRAQYDRVEWWWTPFNLNSATLLVRAKTTGPITGCWPGGKSYPAPLTPPPTGMAAWPARTSACTDVSYKVLSGLGDNFTRYTEMEMMIPDSPATDGGLALVRDFIAFQNSVRSQWNTSVGIHTGVRYVVGDDITLSQFYKRNTTVVSMVVYGSLTTKADPDTVTLFDKGLQNIAMANYSARPHLGKNNYFSQHTLQQAYPDTFTTFVNLYGALDPTSKFINPYLQLLFSTL